ncbi:MAG: polyketide synthase, partial [Chromatiaceae bacterium]|nr:polyketide synthase [Chromatiaceae bacterium]
MASSNQDDIAIIGLSGVFAGSPNIDTFWRNILEKRDQICEAPDSWAMPWYDPEDQNQGIDSARIRTRKVGLLGDLAVFHPLEFGIPPKAVEGDPAHYLALQLAGDALRDAGYWDRDFNRERTGVILGHGSNPNRGDILGMQYGLVIDQTLDLLAQLMPDVSEERRNTLRAALKRSLPKIEIEQAPTLISNIISGRISNRLNLMGPNYLVDSACSSSLIALDLGMRDLRSGRCDMMLIGGVQASMPAQIYMLFQQIGALAHGDIRPFDASANGTLLGEGVGFAVIKRLADARRDGDRIYAILKGVGVASDGKGMGLLAPRVEGEALAIRRAYEQSGIDPTTIELIEAHGTGIPLGDRTELQALGQIFGERRGRLPHCAIGSVKSMIGHCIPAAGIASLIKTSLALHHKLLPPTLCESVNPDLGMERTPFYVNTATRPWVHGGPLPRRAGINAFG